MPFLILQVNFHTSNDFCDWRLLKTSKYLKVLFILLAHLSQRLIGELIVYPCSGVRTASYFVIHNFKHLLLRNHLPDQSQILRGASLGRGNKVCSQHLGHMTNMAATPIYDKNHSKIFFSRTGRPISTKLDM